MFIVFGHFMGRSGLWRTGCETADNKVCVFKDGVCLSSLVGFAVSRLDDPDATAALPEFLYTHDLPLPMDRTAR
jgi:hypothetical protein